jgi:hypothetical protein
MTRTFFQAFVIVMALLLLMAESQRRDEVADEQFEQLQLERVARVAQ